MTFPGDARRGFLRRAGGWAGALLAGLSAPRSSSLAQPATSFPVPGNVVPGVAVPGIAVPGEDALQARAEGLIGYWLAASDDPSRARVLRITNVIFVEASEVTLAGLYGPASAPIWPEATAITLRQRNRQWSVEIASDAEPDLALAIQADGSLRGGEPTLHFIPVDLPRIHRHAADHPLSALRAGRQARIEFVYIGADDCSMCRRWEGIHLGAGARLTRLPWWPQIEFTPIRLATLRKPFAIDDAPARLQPVLFDMLGRGIRIRGVPSFLLLVDGRLRAHALGPAEFDSLLLPTMRAAVRERQAAA